MRLKNQSVDDVALGKAEGCVTSMALMSHRVINVESKASV